MSPWANMTSPRITHSSRADATRTVEFWVVRRISGFYPAPSGTEFSGHVNSRRGLVSVQGTVRQKQLGARMRKAVVEGPTSIGARARARRWRLVEETFPDLSTLRVVDLGGTVDSWLRVSTRPAHVTVINLFEPGESSESWITPVLGDACDAAALLEREGHRVPFDLVFSNSLLEHLGGHAQREKFAAEVRSLAPRHWVQTPYRYFPLEPHWLFPLMQFLPVWARARVAFGWPLVHSRPDSIEAARSAVMWTELVSGTELRSYFPESLIDEEKIFGLTKSLIAVSS